MTSAIFPENEQERLRALNSYDLLDRDVDAVFDTVIRTAADICDVEISVIALIDQDRQYFLARNGMQPRETPRAIAFCAHAILEPEKIFEISDATKDPRFADNPLVTGEIGVRFYAAQPLTTQEGHAIGGLCLIGKEPKVLNDIQRQTLKNLGSVIMALIESRKATIDTSNSLKEAKDVAGIANDAVETQMKQFAVALENMSQGLCMFDAQARLTVCNKLYASMYGLTPELVKPGTSLSEIVKHRVTNGIYAGANPEEYIQERDNWGRTACSERKFHELSDGRRIAISRQTLSDGGWVSTHEDITDLAKVEAMNQRLARIVDDSVNEVFVFDAVTLKFLQVNASACRNLGYTAEELAGLTPIDLKPKFTLEQFEDAIAPLRRGEENHIRIQTIHRRKDGSHYDVDIILQQIHSAGQPVFAAIIEDVTERKQVERELKQSEELFSKAFQANPVPFSISAPDGPISDLNEAWLTTMGYTRNEAIGNSALKLGVWADPNDRARFVDLLQEKGIVNGYETQYRTKSGELRDMVVSGEWVEIRGEPRLFNVSNDVTESRAAKRQLVEHRDRLQELVNEATVDLKVKAQELETALAKEKELNELQRLFVSMASHEFRTPLAIIDGTAQRLKRRADSLTPEDTAQRADKIRDAVIRMTRLMESTLSAARMDAGKIKINIDQCDLRINVLEVCGCQLELNQKHKIICNLKDLPDSIAGDSEALEQVFTNLLSNAVKYSPDGRDITVKGWQDGDYAVVDIQDRGLGIEKDDLPQMFSRFFRAGTSAGIAGTGIGLNLVKTLVELHSGTVSVESKIGEGSTFTVRLPIAGPDQSVEADTKVA